MEAEWEKLSNPGMGAATWSEARDALSGAKEATWSSAVEVSQERLMTEMGLSKCKVVETAHPYEPPGDSEASKDVGRGLRSTPSPGPWRSTPRAPSKCTSGRTPRRGRLATMAQECRTYDHRTTLCVYGGGLSKALVGVGARVHVKAWRFGWKG